MSSFLPPTYFFTGRNYNYNFYVVSPTYTTLAYANNHYLQSTGANPISSATLTTFTGDLSVNNIQIKSYGVNTNTLIGYRASEIMNNTSINNTCIGNSAGINMTSSANGNT